MSKNAEVQKRISGLLQRDDLSDEIRGELDRVEQELRTPLQTDVWIYRVVVSVLGIVVISTVFGGIYIEVLGMGAANMTLPQAVVSIGSAAIGALAGLLAPSPSAG